MTAPGRAVCRIRCSAEHEGGRQRVCGQLWGTVYATDKGIQIETGMNSSLKGTPALDQKRVLGRVPPLTTSRLSRALGRGDDRVVLVGACGSATVTDRDVLAHLRRHNLKMKPLMIPPDP